MKCGGSTLLLAAAAAAMAASSVSAAIEAHAITSLPGWSGPLPSKQYSGYLSIGGGKYLHYWYVESENDPSTDPVVMWMNGGPGCSSMDGFFHEQGPFAVESKPGQAPSLSLRRTRWNRIANMLWLDAPAGVGLSYATNAKGLVHNDSSTAADNWEALQQFFKGFPERMSNDFYISGESYAGVYVPTLAYKTWSENQNPQAGAVKLNLKGILVGNGCIGSEVGACSQAQSAEIHSAYLYRMGLYSTTLRNTILNVCGDFGPIARKSEACLNALSEMHLEVGPVDIYDVMSPCINSGSAATDDDNYDDDTAVSANAAPSIYHKRPVTPFEKEVFERANRMATARGLPPAGPVECFNTGPVQDYLNQADVRMAIHAQPVSVIGNWTICTSKITYYSTEPNEPRDIYPTLIKNYRVTIFNGQSDACVPFNDNEAWTSGMNIPVKQAWKPWYYTDPEAGTQVAGYTVQYENDFVFTTVLNSGHMVPQFAPHKAYTMFENYLLNKPY